jgi:hydroxymethylpyrimidine pyrophosphatase-like HAD family hydrolase
VRLVCLDFDGTVMVYDDGPGYFHPDVIAFLNALEPRGIRWCSNSGRDRDDQLRVIEASRQRGLRHEPDALVCSESLVYLRDGTDFLPLEPWNSDAFRHLEELHQHVQARLEPVRNALETRYQPRLAYVGPAFTAYMLKDVDGLPEQFAAELEALLHGVPNWMLTRNGGWVAVLHVNLGKGNALTAYATHRGLPARHILAVGDQLNDLNMLEGDAAHHVGCPGNALPEVQDVVRKKAGYIATAPAPEGTLAVLKHFLG